MRNFSSATSNVAKKVSTTLNEATKKTEKGVDVGFYSVIKTEDGAYDILDSRTKDTLFEGLRMYKSAYVIVTHLNEGKKIKKKLEKKGFEINNKKETYVIEFN